MQFASNCEALMVYVDENLCTACGICLEACNHGAISIGNMAAMIDETLCTSCGRCADVCPSEAIIIMEVQAPESAAGTPLDIAAPVGETQTLALSSPVPGQTAAMKPSEVQTRSRLGMVEQVVSGLLSLVTQALDVKRSLSPGSADRTAATDSPPGPKGVRGRTCPRGQRPGAGRRGLGGARGPAGGRGLGGGQGTGRGRNNACGNRRGNRAT